MADLDHVKPTLNLARVRRLLDAVVDTVQPAMQEAWRRGDLPESTMLEVQAAQRDVRRRVDRSHRARVQASTREPGPKLTRLPDVRYDPQSGAIGEHETGMPVYVFAKPGELDHG